MCNTYVKSGSARKVRQFWCKFQDITALYSGTIHRTVYKLRQTGSCHSLTKIKDQVLNEEIVNELGATLKHNP